MNTLQQFIKQSVGSKGNIFSISPVISPSGDFGRLSGIETIISSWDVILRTPEGSYDNDPEFGSNLMNFIFQPADDSTLDQIKSEITKKLSRYDDRAKIVNLNVNYLPNRKGFTVDIIVDYHGNKDRLSAIIDEATYFQFLSQT